MVAPSDEKEPIPLTNDMGHNKPTSQPFDFNMGSSASGGVDGIADAIAAGSGLSNAPIPGMGQMPNNMQPQQPQKSHLAEILGSHEMNQLKTMSRSSDYGSTGGGCGAGGPNMPPTQNMNRPNNQGK